LLEPSGLVVINGCGFWRAIRKNMVLARSLCHGSALPMTVPSATVVSMIVARLVIALSMLMTSSMSRAHVGATGQDYSKFKQANGLPCCNNEDCRPTRYEISGDEIVMYPDGQRIVLPRTLQHALTSDDGNAHWCGILYPDGSYKTFCAILPMQSVSVPGLAMRVAGGG